MFIVEKNIKIILIIFNFWIVIFSQFRFLAKICGDWITSISQNIDMEHVYKILNLDHKKSYSVSFEKTRFNMI
jgi:hypothetical protein